MSNVTSAPGAGADKVTVKVALVVPLFPSTRFTSLIVRFGMEPAQLLAGELMLRGNGPDTRKSAALLPVSVQPPALRKSAVVLPGAAAGPGPS